MHPKTRTFRRDMNRSCHSFCCRQIQSRSCTARRKHCHRLNNNHLGTVCNQSLAGAVPRNHSWEGMSTRCTARRRRWSICRTHMLCTASPRRHVKIGLPHTLCIAPCHFYSDRHHSRTGYHRLRSGHMGMLCNRHYCNQSPLSKRIPRDMGTCT